MIFNFIAAARVAMSRALLGLALGSWTVEVACSAVKLASSLEWDYSGYSSGCEGPATEGTLISKLVGPGSGYEATTRPSVAAALRNGSATPMLAPSEMVQLQMQPFDIGNLDTSEGTFTADYMLRTIWYDAERLYFNSSDNGGCFPPGYWVGYPGSVLKAMWTPHVYVFDEKSSTEHISAVWLQAETGKVWKTSRHTTTVRCFYNFACMCHPPPPAPITPTPHPPPTPMPASLSLLLCAVGPHVQPRCDAAVMPWDDQFCSLTIGTFRDSEDEVVFSFHEGSGVDYDYSQPGLLGKPKEWEVCPRHSAHTRVGPHVLGSLWAHMHQRGSFCGVCVLLCADHLGELLPDH